VDTLGQVKRFLHLNHSLVQEGGWSMPDRNRHERRLLTGCRAGTGPEVPFWTQVGAVARTGGTMERSRQAHVQSLPGMCPKLDLPGPTPGRTIPRSLSRVGRPASAVTLACSSLFLRIDGPQTTNRPTLSP
jgi:hypothetical protein